MAQAFRIAGPVHEPQLRVEDEFLQRHVECYAGYMGEETPRQLQLGPSRVVVVKVLDRWLAPDHRYFKIEGDDGGMYILRYEVVEQRWELTMFESRALR